MRKCIISNGNCCHHHCRQQQRLAKAKAVIFSSCQSNSSSRCCLWIIMIFFHGFHSNSRCIHAFTLLPVVGSWLNNNNIDNTRHCQKQQQQPWHHVLSYWKQRQRPYWSLQMANTDCNTDISICIPKFHHDDDDSTNNENDDDGSLSFPYPSPLHYIHVKSIMTNEQAATCLTLARQYASTTGRWEQPDMERHASYATCDFPIEQATELNDYLQNVVHFNNRIWDQLIRLYGGDGLLQYEDLDYLDFFCVNYRAKTSKNNLTTDDDDENDSFMDRLELHRDGSLLSFSITLTPPSEFQGGGTTFDALSDPNSAIQYRDYSQETTTNTFFNNQKESPSSFLIWNEQGQGVIRPTRAGDAVFHSGKLLHGADVVTFGERTVLVGFVNVAEWCCRPGALTAACRDWGRMDVAKKRLERQVAKTTTTSNNHHPTTTATIRGWVVNNDKWLPKTRISHLRGFCPAFSSVVRRADPDYQRQQRLKAEDVLLRRILLDPSELQGAVDYDDEASLVVLDGDVTIL